MNRLVALLVRAGRIARGSRSRLSRGGLLFAAVFSSALPAYAGYKIENIPLPAELRGGLSGVAFAPSGTLAVCTRYGEVWLRTTDGKWHRFARGLNEPMGLVAESDRVIYVAHRPEVLRASDSDGDGVAETFDALGGQWGETNNYHEFFFGLRRDRAGNFYGTISTSSTGGKTTPDNLMPPTPIRGERRPQPLLLTGDHRSDVPWRGWAVKITPDGRTERLASGFRQPNGVGLSPEGEFFVNDNQGDYKPSCGLLHVAPGDFHGHVQSLKWDASVDPKTFTIEEAWRRYKSPAVVFPHGPMGISGGEPVWDESRGKFGPYAGQVFAGDYGRLVIRASLEKVADAWQGACYPFLGRNENPPYVAGEKLIAGGTRAAFAPDGSLYIAATAGWGAGADGLQRVAWDGNAAADLREVKLTQRGFAVSFTRPMNAATLAKTEAYEITRFRFYYQHKYGSPWVDETRVPVKEVRVAADGLSAEVVLGELVPGFVYELSVPTLRTREGEALANPLAYYTANRLLNGERTVGGTTRLPRPGEDAVGSKDADTRLTAEALLTQGEKTYRFYCTGCHQPDGRGIPGGAANFRDDKTRLAKPDAALIDVIVKGNEQKGMPAFGAILNAGQRRAVLAYLRETFGEKAEQK